MYRDDGSWNGLLTAPPGMKRVNIQQRIERRRLDSAFAEHHAWTPIAEQSPMTPDVADTTLKDLQRWYGSKGWEYRLVEVSAEPLFSARYGYGNPATVVHPVPVGLSPTLNLEASKEKLSRLTPEDLQTLQRAISEERTRRGGTLAGASMPGYAPLEGYSTDELEKLLTNADLERRRRTERGRLAEENRKAEAASLARFRWSQQGKAGMEGLANFMRGVAWAMACRGALRWSQGHKPTYGVTRQSGEPWKVSEILAARTALDQVPARRVKGRFQKYENPLAWAGCPPSTSPAWNNLLPQFPTGMDF